MILGFASGLYVRLFAYKLFLVSHIVLSIFVLIGCWYHIKFWIGLTWGYETWLYAACAAWSFDRLVRLGRIFGNGLRRAKVTEICGGYVRVDVAGVGWDTEPGKHVYAYFPTLNPLRPWKSHPFSVLQAELLDPLRRSGSPDIGSPSVGSDQVDKEKNRGFKAQTTQTSDISPTLGLTLFIQKSTGMTKQLRAQSSLLVLLEGPYSNNPTKEILRCDGLLLIGGGIGITGLLSWAYSHHNVKLCWSAKKTTRCLVESLDGALNIIAEKDVRIGARMNVGELLSEEMEAGWRKIGVVVSGPGLCDDVRAAVVAAGRRGDTVFELEVEAYSW